MSAAQALKTTDFDQKVLKSTRPVLIDFWAEWCGPCKPIGAILDEIAPSYDGKIDIYKVNVDQESTLASRFRIMSLPTLLILKNGKEMERMIGSAPKANVVSFIQRHL